MNRRLSDEELYLGIVDMVYEGSVFDSQTEFKFRWTKDSLKKIGYISPLVQNHLKHVYFTLFCIMAAASAGAYIHISVMTGRGVFTTLAFCYCSIHACSLLYVLVLSICPSDDDHRWWLRFSSLMGVSLLHGGALATMIPQIMPYCDPTIFVAAFLGAALVSACFSAAAIVFKRREDLYLGGLLFSVLSIFYLLRFDSFLFEHSVALLNVVLYFSLPLFLMCTVFDTQDMIERAQIGDLDYVKHALTIFDDFISVSTRIRLLMERDTSYKGGRDEEKRGGIKRREKRRKSQTPPKQYISNVR